VTAPGDVEFVYVGDPMCSWCWGFAPALELLVARYSLPVRVIVGGLRTGPAAPVLDGTMRAFLAHLVKKAGLPTDTRLTRCKVSRYRVVKWKE
jgi:putative protein-disulfide isomerase